MTHPARTKSAARSQPDTSPRVGAKTAFSVSANKTVAASRARTFAAWTDPRRRAHWLVGVRLVVRARKAPTSARLTCVDDDTDITVKITSKGRTLTVVAVSHTRLASAQLVAERRHCWKEMLRNLKRYLESQGGPERRG